jgi:argonaute-like protein implicated in RNA metabolism and viral defense
MAKDTRGKDQSNDIFTLSVKDFLHLDRNKYIDHDNSQYVLKQPLEKKEEPIRPTVILKKSEVAQYFATGRGDDADAKLAKKARHAIEVLKEHLKEEEAEKAEAAEEAEKVFFETPQKQIIEEAISLDFENLISDKVVKGLKDM